MDQISQFENKLELKNIIKVKGSLFILGGKD